MFDYQAGEKYKLTLIMVGLAGVIAGMFFTLLLVPTESGMTPKQRRAAAQNARISSNPDITGMRPGPSSAPQAAALMAQEQDERANAGAAHAESSAQTVSRADALAFMQTWLPRVWDLSAQTAYADQEEAIKWMTPECASAYRQNIWSAETAKQVTSSGLMSEFHTRAIDVSNNLQDGSVVVKVRGTQVLRAPAGQKSKEVHLEYMLKQTNDGIRVAGISEAGPS